MPLVVPLLRASLLFINVFQTYKTLKLPKPSSRSGQPSARAMTQRKRDMKGCMAVWLVWCCFAIFERTMDGILAIFVPFYNELKGLVLVFLILTRAKGAEPIYLHVIRPLVKPYVTTLDWTLDVAHMIGDFLLLLLSLPISMVVDWWKAKMQPSAYDLPADLQAPQPASPSGPVYVGVTINNEQVGQRKIPGEESAQGTVPPVVQTRTRRHAAHVAPERTSKLPRDPESSSHTQAASSSRSVSQPRIYHPPSLQPSTSQHQIWYPPDFYDTSHKSRSPEGYDEHDAPLPVPPPGMRRASTNREPTPAPTIPESLSVANEETTAYPPFPSAYPISPASDFRSLPELSFTMPPIRLALNEEDATITVDMSEYGHSNGMTSSRSHLDAPFSSRSAQSMPVHGRNPRRGGRHNQSGIEVDEQGFGVSLERQRESNNEDSGSRGGSSDESGDERERRSLPKILLESEDADMQVDELLKSEDGASTIDEDDEDHKVDNDVDSAIDLDKTITEKTRLQVMSNGPLLRSSIRNARLRARDLPGIATLSVNSEVSSVPSMTSSISGGNASLSTIPMSRQQSHMSRSTSSGSQSVAVDSDTSSLAGRKRPRPKPARAQSKDSLLSSASESSRSRAAKVASKKSAIDDQSTQARRKINAPRTTKRVTRIGSSEDDSATQSENIPRGRVKSTVSETKEPATKRRRVTPLERTNLPVLTDDQERVNMRAKVVSKKGSVS